MTMENGFIKLVRKQPELKVKPIEIKKPKTKPEFKKGTWKHWLYKRLKNFHAGKFVEKFHNTKLENLVVYSDGKPRVTISNKKLSKAFIEKLEKKYSDPYLLINSGDDIFTKIKLTSYKKLLSINKIMIHFEFIVTDDGDDEGYMAIERDYTVDSINELFRFINRERIRIDTVYEDQSRIYWYTQYSVKYKIMVLHKDGSVEYFKNDINKFMKAYDLLLI